MHLTNKKKNKRHLKLLDKPKIVSAELWIIKAILWLVIFWVRYMSPKRKIRKWKQFKENEREALEEQYMMFPPFLFASRRRLYWFKSQHILTWYKQNRKPSRKLNNNLKEDCHFQNHKTTIKLFIFIRILSTVTDFLYTIRLNFWCW